MNIKSLLSVVIPAFMATSLHAQDRIFQGNGNVIKAKVISVAGDNVVYKLWSHQDGPDYSIAKNEVDKIKYESGKQEWFTDNTTDNSSASNIHEVRTVRKVRRKMDFGNKILSFAPVMLTEQGVGFSASYEQAIDKDGIVSFNLPLIASFSMNGDNYDNYTSSYYPENRHQDAMVYFCPGLKFYPTSMFGKLKYAIGPSVVIGAGQETNDYYYGNMPQYSSYYYGPANTTQDKFILGMIVTNSLNISPTKHFTMGVDYNFGFTYLNRVNGNNYNYNTNRGMSSLNQFSFRLGYRF